MSIKQHRFNKSQLAQIERKTCNKHPHRTWKYKPKPNKTFPNGCPVCLKIWDDLQQEKQEDEAEKKAENMAKAAPLLKWRKENPDFVNPGNFKKGESGMDRVKKKKLHDYIKDKTVGGTRIANRLLAIAGLHPNAEKNAKGVSHQQQMAALRELLARGFGPVLDPDAKEEQNKGIVVNVLNLANTTFEEYNRRNSEMALNLETHVDTNTTIAYHSPMAKLIRDNPSSALAKLLKDNPHSRMSQSVYIETPEVEE